MAPVDLLIGKNPLAVDTVQAALDALDGAKNFALKTEDMPGPTGESNRLSTFARGKILCLGPTLERADKQVEMARNAGCVPLIICAGAEEGASLNGSIDPRTLTELQEFDGVAFWGNPEDARQLRQALAQRHGPILPIFDDDADMAERCVLERHVSIDTTAAGGNVSLLAGS